MKIEKVPTFTKISIILETLEEVRLMHEVVRYGFHGPLSDKARPMAKDLRDFFELNMSAAAGHD